MQRFCAHLQNCNSKGVSDILLHFAKLPFTDLYLTSAGSWFATYKSASPCSVFVLICTTATVKVSLTFCCTFQATVHLATLNCTEMRLVSNNVCSVHIPLTFNCLYIHEQLVYFLYLHYWIYLHLHNCNSEDVFDILLHFTGTHLPWLNSTKMRFRRNRCPTQFAFHSEIGCKSMHRFPCIQTSTDLHPPNIVCNSFSLTCKGL